MEENNTMDALLEKKAKDWRERLKNCMDAGRYTQLSFAESLNKKYGTRFGQKDVSRWMNTGAKTKNGEVGFPKYDTMLLIADYFCLDVGYLTGETDEELFSLEKACSFMGLNGEAIKAIREITHPENETSYMLKEMRESINNFFSADGFLEFFNSLFDLYQTSMSVNEIKKSVIKDIDGAIDSLRGLEYEGKIERYELNEALILLINELYPKPSS
jgi:transcriptional regulator with XRE-family HTH domain